MPRYMSVSLSKVTQTHFECLLVSLLIIYFHFCLLQFQDVIDIDFQTSIDMLAAEWSGFHHPHQTIEYKICYTTEPSVPANCVDVGEEKHYKFNGISLTPFQVFKTS